MVVRSILLQPRVAASHFLNPPFLFGISSACPDAGRAEGTRFFGAGTEILDESNTSGTITNEYVFFGGKRVAMRAVSSGTIYYYEEDMLGSALTKRGLPGRRLVEPGGPVQAGQTSVCGVYPEPVRRGGRSRRNADFYPFGGERISVYTPTSAILAFFDDHLGSTSKFESVSSAGAVTLEFDADYAPFGRVREFGSDLYDPAFKFMGKEYDGETGLDNFGARYNDSTIGRFISAAKRAPRSTASRAWEIGRAVPAPVTYANLTNPQTLNLYAMVSDNPETFADLDGHNSGLQDCLVDVCTENVSIDVVGDGPPEPSNTGDKQPLSDSQEAADANPNVQSDEQNSSQKKTNDQEDKDKPKPDDPTPGTQPSKAGGATGGGQGKGERRFTGKPEYKPGKPGKPPKGWRKLPDGRWQYADPHSGRKITKPANWEPSWEAVKKVGLWTTIIGGAGAVLNAILDSAPYWAWAF